MNRPEATPPDLLSRGTRTRRVLVRDMVLDASIGVYGHERARSQRVRINLDLAVIDDRAPEDDIAKTRNFGKKSLQEIKEKLNEWGLSLGMTDYSSLKASKKLQQQQDKEEDTDEA